MTKNKSYERQDKPRKTREQHLMDGKQVIDINSTKLLTFIPPVKCLNDKQGDLKRLIKEKEIIICIGPAGTGKTYLTLLQALNLLKTEDSIKQLTLCKSLIQIKGEETGFLPGDLNEKLDPMMYSYTGNVDKMLGDGMATKFRDAGLIKWQPLAFIRGVQFDNQIVIIDEAQNIDRHTFKSIISRIGKNSKLIFLGDFEQIDRKKSESCLKESFDLFESSERVGTLQFTKEDECVRNPIIPYVLEILNENGY